MSKANQPDKVTVYLVVRDAFEAHTYAELYYTRAAGDGDPSRVPVRAFASEAAAEGYARQLDAELRAAFPPPLFAEVDYDDDLPTFAAAMTAKLSELGLPAVKFGKEGYNHAKRFRQWWAKHAAGLSAEQRAALWEPFADVTFHRVQRVEVEG